MRNDQAILGRAVRGVYDGLVLPVVDDYVYGAIDIDPVLLTIQCLFENEAALHNAKEKGTYDTINQRIKVALQREKYPKRGIEGTIIGFSSLQDVNESGSLWRHFR